MSNSILKSANEVMDTIFGNLPYTAEDRYYEILNNISIAVVDYRVKHGFSQKQYTDFEISRKDESQIYRGIQY